MVVAKKFIIKKFFEGFPKEGDLELIEEKLPPLKNAEFLAEAVYLSIDPYMRAYVRFLNCHSVPDTFIGLQLAKIIDSKNPEFPIGKYVIGPFGWRTHTISNGERPPYLEEFPSPTVLPEFGNFPLSLALGVLGHIGLTAYFGFLEICRPKAGETVVVSGAAGATGSIVGQIAKIKGCKVIGIAGSDEKGKWLVNDLGFDCFINYKTDNIDEALTRAAPYGIDCYFDNVGGEISSKVIYQMNKYGRVSVCGSISNYNDVKITKATAVQMPVVLQSLKMEGFLVIQWIDRWNEGTQQLMEWVNEGKLKYRETVTDGFENMFSAFVGLLRGENLGKAIVKV